jgi:exonuclease SbcC
MMLKSLSMKNIRSYVDETINFPLGSTLLAGEIGSGKSTILLALDFALFGTRRGEIEGSELLRHGKNTGSVELEMEVDGKDLKLKRTLKRSKNYINQDSGELSINGFRQEYMPTELKAKMLEILGYPNDMIRKNRPIFRYTVYTPQEEMKNILFNSETRLDILRKIFNMDRYSTIKNNAGALVIELRSMKRELGAAAADLEEKKKEMENREYEKRILGAETDAIKNELLEISNGIDEKKKELDALQANISEMKEKKQLISKLESDSKSKNLQKTWVAADIRSLEKTMESIIVEMENLSRLEKPGIPENDLKKQLEELEKERSLLIKEVGVLDSEIRNLSSVLEKGVCSLCRQKVSDRALFIRNLEECRKSLESSGDRLQRAENMTKHVMAELEKHRTYLINYQRHASGGIRLSDMRASREKMQSQLNETEKELESMEKELNLISFSISGIKDLEKKHSDLCSDYEQMQRQKLDRERALARLEQKVSDMEKDITELHADITRKEDIRNRVSRINDINYWLENYFFSLMETIEKHVMAVIQHEFDVYFQKWFTTIMPDENITVRISDNFVPVIEQNGYETDYTNLSGGEKTSIALAYRLALNKVINSMIESIKTKDIIILDEPTDGFSSDQLDRIRDVIEQLNLKQIIIVSHEPKIDTFVDNVIRIYKENHVSRIG